MGEAAPPATLTTKRLRLRPWRDEDLAPFAALNADPAVMAFLGNKLDQAASDAMAGRIRARMAVQGYGLWAVEVPDVAPFIGFVGLAAPLFHARFTPCVEVGWRLAREYWGAGYASEAARAALAFGFGDLGLAEIVSFTSRGNARSRAVMERIGMSYDPRDDFEHPGVAADDPLRAHVLYRIGRREA